MEVLDKLLQLFLQLWRALQLQQHVFHSQIVRYQASVILGNNLWAQIALEHNHFGFVDILGGQRTRMAPNLTVSICSRQGIKTERQQCKTEGCEFILSDHGDSFIRAQKYVAP